MIENIIELLHKRALGGADAAVVPQRSALPRALASDPPAGVLEVRDELVSRLSGSVKAGPMWVFMVGGPGNGKSHQLAELYESLGVSSAGTGVLASRSLPPVPTPNGRLLAINDATIRPAPAPVSGHMAADVTNAYGSDGERPSYLWMNLNRGVLIEERSLAYRSDSGRLAVRLIDWILEQSPAADELSLHTVRASASPVRRTKLGDIEIVAVALDQVSLLERPEHSGLPSPLKLKSDSRKESPAGKLLEAVVSASNFESGLCVGCAAQDLCPMLSNARGLRTEAGAGLLQLARATEIATGQLLTYRDLWALLATAILGRSRSNDASAEGACSWVRRSVAALGDPGARDEAVISLGLQRLQYSLFDTIVPRQIFGKKQLKLRLDPAAPVVRRLELLDPCLAVSDDWASATTDALSAAALNQSPLEQLTERHGAIARAACELDRRLEQRILEYGVVGSGGPAAHMRFLGEGMYRLTALALGHVAFERDLAAMLELWNAARSSDAAVTVLAEAIRRLAVGDGRTLDLPLVAPRVDPANVTTGTLIARIALTGAQAPTIRFRIEGTHVSACLLLTGSTERELRVPVDLQLTREALARTSHGGFTEASAATNPRLERFRAALISPTTSALQVDILDREQSS